MEKKLYELDWILENGDLYADTVVKTMLALPTERGNIVTYLMEAAIKATETWQKFECERHALAAHLAKEQMRERTVTEPFPGFFGEKPWWIWIKEQIDVN